jgi:hypothetical protein
LKPILDSLWAWGEQYKCKVDISEEILYLIDTKDNKLLKTYMAASGKADTPSPVGT